mmetsp:Transcript_15492/g.34796  ORF Transcript_15492/g.34796 Transcript_15492/m.34796 type:complete len:396 (-) Transcript_15492:37-1224(-)
MHTAVTCIIVLAVLSFSDAFSPSLVRRVSLEDYISSKPGEYEELPVVIAGVVSPEETEALVDELIEVLGAQEVDLQRKIRRDGSPETEIYSMPLSETIDFIMDSSHDDAFFAFCEGLLPCSIPGSEILSRKLEAVRDAPFPGVPSWFDFFPRHLRPSDAVILAGAGASSTLHRDPFEWTGTSLCLEGTKIWRFVLPPAEEQGGVEIVDRFLSSYRLESIAWEDEERGDPSDSTTIISAGWQSDLSLYDFVDEDFRTAFEWFEMEELDSDVFEVNLERAAVDGSSLKPSMETLDALNGIRGTKGGASEPNFVTAIQRPGDLLIIPAHCWHQTYGPVPSIAIASQRFDSSIARRVIDHILSVSKTDTRNLPQLLKMHHFEDGDGEEVVRELLGSLIK